MMGVAGRERALRVSSELTKAKHFALASLATMSAVAADDGETPQRQLICNALIEVVDRLNGELRLLGEHLRPGQEVRGDA